MLDFPRLAFYKQINAVVLFLKDVVEIVLETQGFHIGLSGYGDGLALAWGGVLFDYSLDVVVVDVVCAATSVDRSKLLGGPCPE